MPLPTLAFSPAITALDGKPSTSSNEIALPFGKQHLHVMELIRNLLSHPPPEHQSDFRLVEFTDAKCEKRPAYRLTRDGFTGKKALAFKLAYIDAFNRMEAELQQQTAQDAQRMQLASQAGAQVMQAVFDAVMSGSNADWRRARYLLSFGYDHSGQPSLPLTKTVTDGQIVASLPELTQHIAKGDIFPSDTQLAALASACMSRLTERAQVRELQAARPAALSNPATTPATPASPHIGSNGKPLPPGTFRAACV